MNVEEKTVLDHRLPATMVSPDLWQRVKHESSATNRSVGFVIRAALSFYFDACASKAIADDSKASIGKESGHGE